MSVKIIFSRKDDDAVSQILFLYFQLEYFGEVFDSRLCRTSDTACDNCRRGAQVKHIGRVES
jgi:hypothetical protein